MAAKRTHGRELIYKIKEFSSDDKEDEPQKMCIPSSPSESQRKVEDEEMEVNDGMAHASHLMQTAPQGIQNSEVQDTLKLCPCDQFCKMKKERAKEIYPVMEKEGRTRLALITCNKKFDYPFDRDDDSDSLNMQELFENFGYSVVLKENLTAQVMAPDIGATSLCFCQPLFW